MIYTPPNKDAIKASLSGGYVPLARSSISAALGQTYDLVEVACSIVCPVADLVEASCSIPCIVLSSLIDTAYAIELPMGNMAESACELYRPPVVESVPLVARSEARLINQGVLIVRRSAMEVENGCEIVRGSLTLVENACAVLLAVASALVESGVVIEREHLERTPVESVCEIITLDASAAAGAEANQVLTATVSGAITPDGLPVATDSYTAADVAAGLVIESGTVDFDPISISLTIDRSAYAITGSIEVGTEQEYLACRVGLELALAIGSETVSLRIADRKRSRAHGQWRYTLDVQSPSAWLDSPWAEKITEGSYSGTAADIAAAIMAAASNPVVLAWQTVDWPIPADTVLANGQSPLEMIRVVKDAAGAVYQSLADGSLVVEPEYPEAVPQWSTTAATYTVVEAEEVVSAEDDDDWRDGSNAYLVGSVGAGSASTGDIRISEIDNAAGGKTIRVVTVPWNQTMSLSHRGGSWVQLSLIGDRERTETETVQIVDGTGRLQYPYQGMVASDYLEAELGAITITEDGTVTTATVGESLCLITYTTRSREYTLINPRYEEVMVVAIADDAASGAGGAVSVLVTRGLGDKRGEDFTSDLITTPAVAAEKGRNLIDAGSTPRQLVTLLMPFRGLWRTGRLVDVYDSTRPPWRGMLRSQQISISVADDGSQTWDSTITLEREAA